MLDALFAPYGQGLGQAMRSAERIIERCPHDFSSRSRETVSTTLSRMKKRGLVSRSGSKKRAVWRITREGKRHFQVRVDSALPPEDGKVRLVIFDVPERERRKRDWLRYHLLACDYSPLQKSVWMGTRPLPADLNDEFKSIGLTSYVHIVSLEKVTFEKVKEAFRH